MGSIIYFVRQKRANWSMGLVSAVCGMINLKSGKYGIVLKWKINQPHRLSKLFIRQTCDIQPVICIHHIGDGIDAESRSIFPFMLGIHSNRVR